MADKHHDTQAARAGSQIKFWIVPFVAVLCMAIRHLCRIGPLILLPRLTGDAPDGVSDRQPHPTDGSKKGKSLSASEPPKG